MTPKIFIGSSVEGLKLAYAIQENLEYDALCTPWSQGIFELSGNTLENLVKALDQFDFAIFVLTADDVVKIRDKELPTVRDNVIFELGLFIGRLGKDKVYFLIPRNNEDLHLPSDLSGITPGKYDDTATDNLRSALGPFCNKVRHQILQLFDTNATIVVNAETRAKPEISNEAGNSDPKVQAPRAFGEYGVTSDEFDNHHIHISASDFFNGRLARAFPGTRELRILDDPEICVKRLIILLQEPLKFEQSEENGSTRPIWWFRDGSNMFIEKTATLSPTKFLMNNDELKLKRIAVCPSSFPYLSFVYIELEADEQTGLYDIKKNRIDEYKAKGKSYTEEYAIFQNTNIKREEYDDGAAEINGDVVDVYGAELRRKFLSPHNFVITGQDSPINSFKFDKESGPIFDGILTGSHKIEDLEHLVSTLTLKDYYR